MTCVPAPSEPHLERHGGRSRKDCDVAVRERLSLRADLHRPGAPALADDRDVRHESRTRRDAIGNVERIDPHVSDRSHCHRLDGNGHLRSAEAQHGASGLALRLVSVGEQHDPRRRIGRQLRACGGQRRLDVGAASIDGRGIKHFGETPQRGDAVDGGGRPSKHDDPGLRRMDRAVQLFDAGGRVLDGVPRYAVRDVHQIHDGQPRRARRQDRATEREHERAEQQRPDDRLKRALARIERRPRDEVRDPDERQQRQQPQRRRNGPVQHRLTP